MKVLLAIDCLPCSHPELAMVVSRGWPPGTIIRFVTAINRTESISEFFVKDPSDSWAAEQERVVQARRALAAAIGGATARLLPAVLLEEHVLLGHVKEELLRFAEDWRADLIVIGANAKVRPGLPFLGNVAQSVLQHSYCPVHIARLKNADVAPEHQPPISNILVAVDHSPHSNATVDWVLRQGWIPPYRVKLLTALPEVAEQISKEKNAEKASKLVKEQQELKSRVDERLKACALGMEARMGAGLVEYESIEGPPADVILQAAHDWPADLIVIGSHGRSAITRFLLGTVSQSVAINAPCPVEVIKLNSYPIQEKPHEEIHQRTDEDQDRMPHVMM